MEVAKYTMCDNCLMLEMNAWQQYLVMQTSQASNTAILNWELVICVVPNLHVTRQETLN